MQISKCPNKYIRDVTSSKIANGSHVNIISHITNSHKDGIFHIGVSSEQNVNVTFFTKEEHSDMLKMCTTCL